LVTSRYISDSFLHKAYHHALSLAERDESEQQEQHINELIKQTKKTKARIEKLEDEEESSTDIDGLLDDI
jgi:cell division protein FtsB